MLIIIELAKIAIKIFLSGSSTMHGNDEIQVTTRLSSTVLHQII